MLLKSTRPDIFSSGSAPGRSCTIDLASSTSKNMDSEGCLHEETVYEPHHLAETADEVRGKAHEGDDGADTGLALQVEPGPQGKDGDNGHGRGCATQDAGRGPPVDYRKLRLQHPIDHLSQSTQFRRLPNKALHQQDVADGITGVLGQLGVLRLNLVLGVVGAVGDKGCNQRGNDGQGDEHQGQLPVEEAGSEASRPTGRRGWRDGCGTLPARD